MYTVVKILRDDPGADADEIVATINALRPDLAELRGPRARRDGVAVSLGDRSFWVEHLSRIEDFVDTFESAIRRATTLGFRVCVDTAIDTGDIQAGHLWTELSYPPDVARKLGALDIAILVTLYPATEQPDQSSDPE